MVSWDIGSIIWNQRPDPKSPPLITSPIPTNRNVTTKVSDSLSRAQAQSWADPVHPTSDPQQQSIEEFGLYDSGDSSRNNPPNTPIIKTENLEGDQKVAGKNAHIPSIVKNPINKIPPTTICIQKWIQTADNFC